MKRASRSVSRRKWKLSFTPEARVHCDLPKLYTFKIITLVYENEYITHTAGSLRRSKDAIEEVGLPVGYMHSSNFMVLCFLFNFFIKTSNSSADLVHINMISLIHLKYSIVFSFIILYIFYIFE